MPTGQNRKLALPSSLLNELNAQQPQTGRNARSKSQHLSRKEQRKTQRVQKRQSKQQLRTRPALPISSVKSNTKQSKQSKEILSTKSRATSRNHIEDDEFSEGDEGSDDDEDDNEDDEDDEDDEFDSGSDSEMDDELKSRDEISKKTSNSVQKKLDQDSKEIAELERKLGLKGRKSLPKSFDEDGLGDLLDGLDGDDQGDGALPKRKRKSEADEWLAQKRRKAEAAAAAAAATALHTFSDGDSNPDESDEDLGSEDWAGGEDDLREEGEEDDDNDDEGEEDEDGFEGFSENEEAEPVRPQRENPYIAPTTNVAKYVPPSLRKQSQSSNEVEAQLRKRVQGLINRLTNDNMVGITKDFIALYNNNPRQIVTSTLVDTVMALVCSPERRPDSFFTMVAGFIAAIHRAVGMAASAYFLQQVVEIFNKHYEAASGDQSDSASKHLITLLAELYNMQVVGSNLVFDLVRLFLDPLSELNTELLLKVIQLCGPSLRREDPHALRDIVNSIKPANLKGASVRTSFMMDEMKKLQSNKTKAISRNKDLVEQRSQIKKRIGTLEGSRDVQPLRVGLKDVQGADTAGKWWLVGASWAGKQADDENANGKDGSKRNSKPGVTDDEDEIIANDFDDDDLGVPDLWELAKQQGFNTEVRQRIFVALHAATDYENADLLIRNLRLNKHQRKEIPEVIVRSGERQQAYNHFYTLVAGRFCALNKELAFQFRRSLTVRFARMGEEMDALAGDDAGGGGAYEGEEEEDYDMRWLYNAARMYGSLVAGASLRLADVLKHRNLVAMQAEKAHMFVEVMMLTVLQETKTVQKPLRDVLVGVDRELGRGLQYFMRKKLRRSDLLGDNKKEKKELQKRCDEVDAILDAMLAENPVG